MTNVLYFKKRTDSTSYAIIEYTSGTGVSMIVATQKKGKAFKEMDIGVQGDSDAADPLYRTTTYNHDPHLAKIFVTIDDEKAKSKFKVKKNGVLMFKDGYDMDNAETYDLIKKQTLGVLKSGEIKILEQSSHIE